MLRVLVSGERGTTAACVPSHCCTQLLHRVSASVSTLLLAGTHIKVCPLQTILEFMYQPGEPCCGIRCRQLKLVVVTSIKVAVLEFQIQAG